MEEVPFYVQTKHTDCMPRTILEKQATAQTKPKIVGKTNIASTVPLYFSNITTSFLPAILSEVAGSNMWLLSSFCLDLKPKLSNVVEDSTCNKIKMMKYNFL